MDAAFGLVTPVEALLDSTSLPLESMEYTEMSGPPPKLVTYMNFPDDSMAMLDGFVPVAIVPPDSKDNVPFVKMPKEKTLLLDWFAT